MSRQNKTESNIEQKNKIKYNKTAVYSGPWVMMYITAKKASLFVSLSFCFQYFIYIKLNHSCSFILFVHLLYYCSFLLI